MRKLVSASLVVLAMIAPWTAGAQEAVKPFHVMLVNDDGVDAPGIAALATVLAADPAYRLTVVAPTEQQSGKGHALVIRDEIAVVSHEPVAGAPTWSVGATPASVVRLGLSALLLDDPPDLVISGINKGENVGRIHWYSGTVGGAREAVMAGTPAVAFSLQLDWTDPKPDFETAARLSKPIVDSIRRFGLPEGVYLNVNIPLDPKGVKGYRLCRQGVAVDQLNRYDEVRENRTLWRSLDVPITSIAVEEIENIVARRSWVRGKSAGAPMIVRDRAYGVAEIIEWGSGRKSETLPEHLQMTVEEQRARKKSSG